MNNNYSPIGDGLPAEFGSRFRSDTPRAIVADWCDDHGRESEAVALRSGAQVAVERGRVVVSLTQFVRRLDQFRAWMDNLEDYGVRPHRLIGIGWHVGGAGFIGYLPNPEKGAGVRFVIEAPEHEFATVYAAAVAEWIGRFRPDLADHPELQDRIAALTA